MNKGWKYGIGLGMVIVLLFMANLLIGSVPIPVSDVFSILMGHEGEKASWSFIVWESRLPQALTALFCGGALAVCGLMLQTAFKNPLAGPSILGINSGRLSAKENFSQQGKRYVAYLPEHSVCPVSFPYWLGRL